MKHMVLSNGKKQTNAYQGNRAGLLIWVVVSSPLLQLGKEDGYDTFFHTAVSNKPIQIVEPVAEGMVRQCFVLQQ